jgi:hypothetical protein
MSNNPLNPSEFEFDYVDDFSTLSVSAAEIVEATFADTATEDLSEAMEQQVNAEIAADAQQAADAAVASGDYQSAAVLREVAEEHADAAGDNSMLHGSDSFELQSADASQDAAREFEAEQAELAQAGDYSGAREAASHAEAAMQDADYLASGSDHSGQAAMEVDQMDWAVWHEDQADYYATSAAEYAAEGDFDNAQMYADQAINHQDLADYHGDLGEHGGPMAQYDATSDVTSFDAIDTSTPVDTSSTSYDMTPDVDTSSFSSE